MRRASVLTVVLVLISAIALFAQSDREEKLTPFDKVKIVGDVKVYLEKGVEESIKVTTEGISASEVITEVREKTLVIKLLKGFCSNVKVNVWVTYRELRTVKTSAAACVSLNGVWKVDKAVLNINTSSEFVGSIDANTADIKVGQGANLRIDGKVKNYEAVISSGATFSALELKSDSTFVKVRSGAVAKVFASKLIDAKVHTGGSLTYNGNPEQKSISTLLGATVKEY